MAENTKTKGTTRRTKVKDLAAPERGLTGKDLEKVKGGFHPTEELDPATVDPNKATPEVDGKLGIKY